MRQRPEWDLEKLVDSGLGCGLILLLIMILNLIVYAVFRMVI